MEDEYLKDPKLTAEPTHICDACGARIRNGRWSCSCRKEFVVFTFVMLSILVATAAFVVTASVWNLIRG